MGQAEVLNERDVLPQPLSTPISEPNPNDRIKDGRMVDVLPDDRNAECEGNEVGKLVSGQLIHDLSAGADSASSNSIGQGAITGLIDAHGDPRYEKREEELEVRISRKNTQRNRAHLFDVADELAPLWVFLGAGVCGG
jgi:hypothetical protein